MRKYKLLVVDDEIKIRKNNYTNVLLDDFDLEFVEKWIDIEEVKNQIRDACVDGYILDVYYDKVNGFDIMLKDLIEIINGQKPIILVSSKWATQTDIELLKILNSTKTSVVHFFSWSQFNSSSDDKEVSTALVHYIRKELAKWYNSTMEVIKDNETLSILHLSDLQFGDNNTDKNSFLSESIIPEYLKVNKIKPNIVAITGDIAYSGKTNEYNLAYEWIDTFCKALWPLKDYKERLIIVPGNHDFDLQLCAGDKYEYNFKEKKYEEIKSDVKSNYQMYGLTPFKKFAYNITKDIRWLTDENNLCWMNDTFINWGIRFFHLNTASQINSDDPGKVGVDKEVLVKVSKEIPNSIIGKSILNIIIAHHGPELLGFKGNKDNSSLWPNIRGFIERIGAHLFLCGHNHQSEFKRLGDNEGEYSNDLVTAMAPTLLLDQKLRPSDKRRGFNIIELKRQNGVITNINCRVFEYDGMQISEKSNKNKYNYDINVSKLSE